MQCWQCKWIKSIIIIWFYERKIEDANVASSTNIDNILTSLNTKASDQPDKFADLNTKAQEINKLSENLFIYMSALKDSIFVRH